MIGDPVPGLRQRVAAFLMRVRAGEQQQIAPRDSMLTQPTSRPRLQGIVVAARPR